MDRLKFRVWDIVNNCYSKDFFAIEQDGELMRYEPEYHNDIWNYTENGRYIVEPCTGLKDRFGKLIFIGDKIFDEWCNCEADVDIEDGITILVYDDGSQDIIHTRIKIIGNIHEVKK